MSDTVQHTEEAVSRVGLVAAEGIRMVELAAIAVLALLVSPPLAILAVVVVIPTLVVGAAAAVVALPVLAVRRFHRYRVEHPHPLAHRLAGR